MMMCWVSKKTLGVLLCISSVSVMLILNSHLKSSPRRARYESRHPLSIPLTVDLSRNVTYIRLPDANNELHRYKLERIRDNEEVREDNKGEGEEEQEQEQEEQEQEEEGGGMGRNKPWQQRQAYQFQKQNIVTDEDEFGDRLDDDGEEEEKADAKDSKSPPNGKLSHHGPHATNPGMTHAKETVSSLNITVNSPLKTIQQKSSYLLTISDPRYPRMIGKVLSKLPPDVRKEMSMAIRKVEAKSKRKFQQLPTSKQWEVILRVFDAKGYEQRFPDVINIGVKKSGTNALGFFLPNHPEIVHSIGNEVHYFDWMYEKGLEYYRSRMGFAKASQLEFEKTPRYFVTPDVPARIKRDLRTEPKFIIIVRDPISRLVSDFRHESELKLRKEFKTNRLKYSRRTAQFEGHRLKMQVLDAGGRVNASNELVDTSVYAKHYKNWLRHFPPERILVIDQDKMEKDVHSQMKRVEEFLGLKPYFKPSMFYMDERVHGICLRHTLTSLRNCPAKSTPGVLPKAEIDRDTLGKLKDFYRPMNREFARITGMNFSWVD